MKKLINFSLENNIKDYLNISKLKGKIGNVNKSILRKSTSKIAKASPYDLRDFLGSPVYHTSILYWACILPEKEITSA